MDKDIVLPIKEVEQPKTWKKLPDNFITALTMVRGCASTDESKFHLTCVHLNPDYIEACDNYQLAHFKMKLPVSKAVCVRSDALQYVVQSDMKAVSQGRTWIHFRNAEGLTISCRQYKEKYPDLSFMQKIKGQKCLLPKVLALSMDRSNVYSSQNPDNYVTIQLQKNTIIAEAVGLHGRLKEQHRVKYNGPEIKFRIPPDLFVEVIKRSVKCIVSKTHIKIVKGSLVFATTLGKVV
jgi:DNA polymerase III sliding clamp (beta) subunit (PCNA family)